jgi:hypothetical protein
MMSTQLATSTFCLLALAGACHNHEFERQFFSRLDNRVERSRQLTLEEQYRIFRYGNDVMHPPFMDLADPIAERGAAAVPFLLEQLAADHTDIAARDIMLVFQRMARLKVYNVKSDAGLMSTLSARVERMKDKEWREISSRMLKSILES